MGEPHQCFQIHEDDNVATALDDLAPGPVCARGGAEQWSIEAVEPIAAGHKIALTAIGEGEPIVKFGIAIGFAKEPIAAGAWVHLHNCRSTFDERSGTLDLETGAALDTRYE